MALSSGTIDQRGSQPILIQILGPTGAGKSRVAVHLARLFNGEIISADSMQVYRGFDIGTDKLSPEGRNGVPHHLIDIVDDCSQFNAARFLQAAFRAAEEIRSRGRLPIVCGGTALYLRTMIRGIFPDAPRKSVSREVLNRLAQQQGVGLLWERLQRIDPEYGAGVRRNDAVRIVRALEIYYNHGEAPTTVFKRNQTPFCAYRFVRIGLNMEREELYQRIEERVDRMLERGLLEELRRLRKRLPSHCPPFSALGYRELGHYLDGESTWAAAVEEMKRHSRQFAKRQLTWFRGETDIHWFHPRESKKIAQWLHAQPGLDVDG